MSDIEKKYFTTSDFNKFRKYIIDARVKEQELVNKSDISNLVKIRDLKTKFVTLATKAELKAEQDKIVKLQSFDSNHFCSKSQFKDNDNQNCLAFQSLDILK